MAYQKLKGNTSGKQVYAINCKSVNLASLSEHARSRLVADIAQFLCDMHSCLSVSGGRQWSLPTFKLRYYLEASKELLQQVTLPTDIVPFVLVCVTLWVLTV